MDIARVNRWVAQENARIPLHAQGKVRIEADFDDHSGTILESRPPWDPGRDGPRVDARARCSAQVHEVATGVDAVLV
jgi:hypothetical protein